MSSPEASSRIRRAHKKFNPWTREKRPCAVCGSVPTSFIQERYPDSHGYTRKSFAAEYRLCKSCLKHVEDVRGIEEIRPAVTKKKWRECRIIVYAKTFAWLNLMVSK